MSAGNDHHEREGKKSQLWALAFISLLQPQAWLRGVTLSTANIQLVIKP